jgi:hypothetical protein
MDHQIAESDFVLVVCTATYRRRFEGKEDLGVGKGVRWESLLTANRIYGDDSINDRFIPILLASGTPDDRPIVLSGYTYYQPETDEGYDMLCRRLTRQPLIVPPNLGPLRHFTPCTSSHPIGTVPQDFDPTTPPNPSNPRPDDESPHPPYSGPRLHKRTLTQFREQFVAMASLQQITDIFDDAGVLRSEDFAPPTSGQRRTLVEQYYHTIDLDSPSDTQKLLRAFETLILRLEEANPGKGPPSITRWLESNGFTYTDGRIIPKA